MRSTNTKVPSSEQRELSVDSTDNFCLGVSSLAGDLEELESTLIYSWVNKFRQSINAWHFFAAPVHMGLNFTHAGDTTEVVAYVSPNKARFFTLSAEHFFGIGDIYIDVRTVPILCVSYYR